MKQSMIKMLMVVLNTTMLVSAVYKEKYYAAKLDNGTPFNNKVSESGYDDVLFRMRYLVDDRYFTDGFNTDKLRPILFYAGGAKDIEVQYNNTGFVSTLAE